VPSYRLGIDIGGTFTDATLMSEETGEVQIFKVSSTPQDPSGGFMRVLKRAFDNDKVGTGNLAAIVHATTVATNAIIEGKMAKTGLITTAGFRDILEIARQIRPSLYDLQMDKPQPLVPRRFCFAVRERLDHRGNELLPLSEEEVREAARALRGEGVESIVVCFLHSYLNPAHEEQARKAILDVYPEALVSLSAEVCPEIREYHRASTATVNACIAPIVAGYIDRIQKGLGDAGFSGGFYIMQSSGGIMAAEIAREKPVYIVESGPAAGVMMAAHLGGSLGYGKLMSLDMGGTTAKAGMVIDGLPSIAQEYEVGAAAEATTSTTKATGHPILTPVTDLVEIGAGGGSVAWVDSGGVMHVGPQSAGAEPGPACYGMGGDRPTVTDANLVLGRLNSRYFLGGEMELDVQAAREAIERKCAKPLGLDPVEAARGVLEIANVNMAGALRLVSVRRGHDPRESALVAFGGAGPMHANDLAAELRIPTVIIPPSPGVASSMGLLLTDLRHDFVYSRVGPVNSADLEGLEAIYRDFERQSEDMLLREGAAANQVRFQRYMEMRYIGQSFKLAVPIPGKAVSDDVVKSAVEAFHSQHEQAYGYSAPEEPTELVNLKLTAVGVIPKPRTDPEARSGASAEAARKEQREVYFSEAAGFVPCPVYDRYGLTAGNRIQGPAIIEEMDSTVVVHPGFEAEADEWGNLILGET
jgi:N-methylhydantoinase A